MRHTHPTIALQCGGSAWVQNPREAIRLGSTLDTVVFRVVAMAFATSALVGCGSAPPFNLPGAAGCPGYGQLESGGPRLTVAISPTTAWAAGGLRTSDSGAHWRDVSPAALRSDAPSGSPKNLYPPGFADFYLNGSQAWEMRTFASNSTCFAKAVVFMTADGGANWQQSESINLDIKSSLDAVPQLDFVDASHGFLVFEFGPTNGGQGFGARSDAVLFATSDGGLHWELVSSGAPSRLGIKPVPNCGGPLGEIAFESTAVGWIRITCQSGAHLDVLATRDGGATWTIQHISAPGCPCETIRFTIFDSTHAVIRVFSSAGVTTPGASDLLFETSDAGLSWHRLPPLPNGVYTITMSFVDSSTWFDVVTPPGWKKGQETHDSLYKTTDGGGTWTLVAQDLPLGWPVSGIFFLDNDHGWAYQEEGAAGPPPLGQGVEVLTTSDDGRTWKKVVAQIGGGS